MDSDAAIIALRAAEEALEDALHLVKRTRYRMQREQEKAAAAEGKEPRALAGAPSEALTFAMVALLREMGPLAPNKIQWEIERREPLIAVTRWRVINRLRARRELFRHVSHGVWAARALGEPYHPEEDQWEPGDDSSPLIRDKP